MAKDGWSKAIVVGPVRCNFVALVKGVNQIERKQFGDGTEYEAYGMQCLYPEACQDITKQLAVIQEEAVKAKWGSLAAAPKRLKKPVKVKEADVVEDYPFYDGMRYFSASCNVVEGGKTRPPAIIDTNGRVGLGEEPPMDGSYAMIKIKAKTYEFKGDGISFKLSAVQPISTKEAARLYASMGYNEPLDDSPLGTSDGRADEGFGSVEDSGSGRPENYKEPSAEEGTVNFMD